MKQQYDLKGQIKKNSNVACEYIITSDKEFFETIGEDETRNINHLKSYEILYHEIPNV